METNFTLLGDRILVQLDQQPDHTHLSSGIVVPLLDNVESDGGRPIVKTSSLQYLSSGTVISMSPLSSKRLEESLVPLQVGDRVYVPLHCVSPQYQFLMNRSSLFSSFTGVICVQSALIEAKIN